VAGAARAISSGDWAVLAGAWIGGQVEFLSRSCLRSWFLRGRLRRFSPPTGHGPWVREGPGRAQTGREPPRRLLARYRCGRLKRPGHSETIFVEVRSSQQSLDSRARNPPYPGRPPSCDQLLRPEAMKRLIRAILFRHFVVAGRSDETLHSRDHFPVFRRCGAEQMIAGGGPDRGREGFGRASQATAVMI
jgi:hypothetical protein